jgi:hypothetical protein
VVIFAPPVAYKETLASAGNRTRAVAHLYTTKLFRLLMCYLWWTGWYWGNCFTDTKYIGHTRRAFKIRFKVYIQAMKGNRKVGNYFAEKRRSLSRYSSLADSDHGVYFYNGQWTYGTISNILEVLCVEKKGQLLTEHNRTAAHTQPRQTTADTQSPVSFDHKHTLIHYNE